MAEYPPPTVLSSNFNLIDFIEEDESLTLFEANLRYIKKAGDTVTGNLFFSGNKSDDFQ